MKKLCFLIILISGLSLIDSCKKAPEKFTKEKPLAVEVTREPLTFAYVTERLEKQLA